MLGYYTAQGHGLLSGKMNGELCETAPQIVQAPVTILVGQVATPCHAQ
jgi:hypothetical protein